MSDKLSKRPNMVIFWLVLASGVAVVLVEQAGFSPGGPLWLISRTVFWCAAIAYFSMRIYQFAARKRAGRNQQPESTGQPEN